jgi:hypothetical protein
VVVLAMTKVIVVRTPYYYYTQYLYLTGYSHRPSNELHPL